MSGFGWTKLKKHPDEMPGAMIFSGVLKQICQEYDGTRPYWRSSPWGRIIQILKRMEIIINGKCGVIGLIIEITKKSKQGL